MLQNIVEYFIPTQTTAHPEYQRRVRLVAYTLLITALFSLFYVGVSWVIRFKAGVYIMLISFLGYLCLLFLIKQKLNIIKVANIYGLAGIISICGCIFYSGGFESPVLPWLASTPIVILLLAGKKSGYFWALVAVNIILCFGLMDYSGYIFPKQYSTEAELFYFLSCHTGLVLIIFLISIVFENVRIKAYNEINKQKNEVQNTLLELKTTQAQLIQSEKMASLGELTAGIAHEIQNPLNFVLNFSEINKELTDELRQELKAGNYLEVDALAQDIDQNLHKIHHHGKRADSIVRGMLMHSRISTSHKEPTDLNALALEYYHLAYHGQRAKEKSFNAQLITDFDSQLGKAEVVPQEFGRVLLNLFNNAFYATQQKHKIALTRDNQEPYQPKIWISTKKSGNEIELKVRDNGIGIPEAFTNKVFQPFFTTKPTGQGTGLGLSLSYDIVTKTHSGEFLLETEEGEFTEFTIKIPVTK
jgi:two-component system, NtrC family, sensor kinase